MRSRNRRWFLAWRSPRGSEFGKSYCNAALLVVVLATTAVVGGDHNTSASINNNPRNGTKSSHNENRGVFSPRMNYEQWTPLGMGDPLKNDPTYDYVPPVLERVHYWIDPVSRKSDKTVSHVTSATATSPSQQKTEILVLGVSSKKPSSGSSTSTQQADSRRDYESFFKYIDSPKYNINYQRHPRPQYTMMASPSYIPSYYSNKNHIPERTYPKREQNIPYTLLMPPPLPPVKNILSLTQSTTPAMITSNSIYPTTVFASNSDVTVQDANLIFQSSSIETANKWKEPPQHHRQDQHHQQDSNRIKPHTVTADSSSHVTWRTPHPNALISRNATEKAKRPPAESYMQFKQMFNHNRTIHKPIAENVKIKHSFQLAPIVVSSQQDEILSSGVMRKGLVTDEAMDIASTYVHIGKPEAEVDSSSLGVSGVSIQPPQLLDRTSPIVLQPAPAAIAMRKQPQTLQSMKTRQPSQVKTNRQPLSSLHALLQKEATNGLTLTSRTTTTTSTTTSPETTVYVTPSPLTTTTTTTLTTDPLFRHYKQPSEPIRGPMYLIIQGHSKVKTYGPVKQIHGINVQETNEIQTFDDKHVYQVKHLHHHKRVPGILDKRSNRGGREYPYNLQNLKQVVQTNLGAIDIEKYENATIERRNDDNVKETELIVGYDVSENATTEKYYRGFVEKEELVRLPQGRS